MEANVSIIFLGGNGVTPSMNAIIMFPNGNFKDVKKNNDSMKT